MSIPLIKYVRIGYLNIKTISKKDFSIGSFIAMGWDEGVGT